MGIGNISIWQTLIVLAFLVAMLVFVTWMIRKAMQKDRGGARDEHDTAATLEHYHRLYRDGAISEAEYNERKRRLLEGDGS